MAGACAPSGVDDATLSATGATRASIAATRPAALAERYVCIPVDEPDIGATPCRCIRHLPVVAFGPDKRFVVGVDQSINCVVTEPRE